MMVCIVYSLLKERRAVFSLTKESHRLSYEKRLERLGLTDMKTRRERRFHTDLQNRARSREGKLANPFKTKLPLYLNEEGRNTHIYS